MSPCEASMFALSENSTATFALFFTVKTVAPALKPSEAFVEPTIIWIISPESFAYLARIDNDLNPFSCAWLCKRAFTCDLIFKIATFAPSEPT